MRSLFRSGLFLILFTIHGLMTPVSAQENTPQPNQSYILSWSSEIIFPQAVRFSVTLARPLSEVVRANLRIRPANGEDISIDIILDQTAVVSEPYSELAYIWEIPHGNAPALFQNVSFSWQIISNRDEVAQVEDSFIFTDQRAAWVQGIGANGRLNLTLPDIGPSAEAAQFIPLDELVPATPRSDATSAPEATMEVATLVPLAEAEVLTPAFGLTPGGAQPTTDAPDPSGVRLLLTHLEPVYDLMAENTDSSPSFNIIVYTDVFTPGCIQNVAGDSVAIGPVSGVEIACDSSLATFLIRNSGYDLVQSTSGSLNVIEADLTAYLTDSFYRPLWTGKDVPAWYGHGLARFYTDSLKTTWYPPLLAAARSKTLFSLQQMATLPTDRARADLWQAQSYGMVLYIADQLGVPGLFALARDIQSADSFDQAVESALNRPLTSLLPGFERWIFTSQAASAFGFTPYQAATPSFTPSRTPTFTPTPTSTFTLTPTFTPTVTGVLTDTPTPTPFPSSTPTAEPSTPTPRPPGSLNTPVPPPTPAPQVINPVSTLSNPVVALGILTIGLVVIAVVALMFTRFRGK